MEYCQGMKKLTSTSYVLLGQLAIQPWSAYALNKHFQRSAVRSFWPRVESHVYGEIKNLAAHGLATVKDEGKGKRQRSVYYITEAGRGALCNWVAEPGNSRMVEWEQLAKIWYADHGTKEQMREHLAAIRSDALGRLRWMLALMCETDPPAGRLFPQRSHIGVLMGKLNLMEIETILGWVDRVEAEIAGWEDTQYSDAGERTYQSVFADVEERAKALLNKFEI